MNPNILIGAILGHFVGDYLLQNQWMAINKSKPGWLGNEACSLHVLLYTLAVCLFSWVWNPAFILAVALPHYMIDRHAFAWKILEWKNGKANVTPFLGPDEQWNHQYKVGYLEAWKISFAAPVYIANDNTMHFVCLWLAARYLA